MPRLYVAVYLSKPPPSEKFEAGVIPDARPLWSAIRHREWPYDLGDDPSFFMSRERGLPVSWGARS